MTKRYPFGGTFGGGDAGDASDFKRIALGIFECADGFDNTGSHAHEGMSGGSSRGNGFGGDVDHRDFAAFGVVREL